MSEIKDNIPAHAVTVRYHYGKSKGQFYVWSMPKYVGAIKNQPYRWQWSALANCGEEATYEKAVESARSWVRDSISH